MKPRTFACLVWLWQILLGLQFGIRFTGEYPLNGPPSHWWSLFGVRVDTAPGIAVIVVFAVLTAAVARWLAARVRVRRWVGAGVIVVVVLACFAAAIWSKSYWGYWISRPEPSLAWWQLESLDGLSSIRCDREPRPVRCEIAAGDRPAEDVAWCMKDPYECTDERLPLALHRGRLLRPDVAPVSARVLREVEQSLSDDRVLAREEPGYHGNAFLGGWIASGGRTIALCVSGAEVSNDHHAVYEMTIANGRIEKQRTFFYDVAGIEGTELPLVAVWCSAIAFLLWLPGATAFGRAAPPAIEAAA